MFDHNLTTSLPIILATESKYKKQILEKLGMPFTATSPCIDETPLNNEPPELLVTRLAEQKALKIAADNPDNYIIGADQVACFNNQILGKPGTKEEATEQLTAFSGNKVDFLTGIALYDKNTQQVNSSLDVFSVYFNKLSDADIEHYLNLEQPYDCAGSFKSEGIGILLFSKLEGKDPNSLIGLPLISLAKLFDEIGINLLAHIPSDL